MNLLLKQTQTHQWAGCLTSRAFIYVYDIFCLQFTDFKATEFPLLNKLINQMLFNWFKSIETWSIYLFPVWPKFYWNAFLDVDQFVHSGVNSLVKNLFIQVLLQRINYFRSI